MLRRKVERLERDAPPRPIAMLLTMEPAQMTDRELLVFMEHWRRADPAAVALIKALPLDALDGIAGGGDVEHIVSQALGDDGLRLLAEAVGEVEPVPQVPDDDDRDLDEYLARHLADHYNYFEEA